MSINAVYVTEDEPVAKYVKTVNYMLSGHRLTKKGEPTDFVLQTPSEMFDKDMNRIGYDESEVLHLYSETELAYFKRMNKYLLQNGLIKPYTEQAVEEDYSNMLDDYEVDTIATTANLKAFEKKVYAITSKVSLNRILSKMRDLGRKESFINLIMKRIEELE